MRRLLAKSLAQFRQLLLEYGVIALVVHYVIFAVVLVGFWAGIRLGLKPSDAFANAGAWTAAYIATKLTQPVRIVVTIAITPFVAKVYERVTGRPRQPPAP